MATTSPDNIPYPAPADSITPIENWFSNNATATQTALTAIRNSVASVNSNVANYNYRWANATARGNQSGMRIADMGYQVDTDTLYRYNGSAWFSWESGWITWPTAATSVQGISGAADANPGWSYSYNQYRYTGGKVRYRFAIVLNSGGTTVNAQISATIPIATAGVGNGATAPGQLKVLRGTNEYLLHYSMPNAGNRMYTAVIGTNGSAGPTGPTLPLTFAAGDVIAGEFEYDVF